MTLNRYSPKAVSKLLRSNRIHLTKRFGQNFLIDRHKAEEIIHALNPRPKDHILEIGPGIGALTALLPGSCACISALEIDRGLVKILGETDDLKGKINLYEGDALKFSFQDLSPVPLRVLSNLPYNIASQILYRLTSFSGIIQDCLIMLPDTVLPRFTASCGDKAYGLLSIIMAVFYTIKDQGIRARKELFFPRPEVNSKIISLVPKISGLEDKSMEFIRFVSGVFQNRRKRLFRTLEHSGWVRESRIAAQEFGLDEGARPENAPPDFYHKLFQLVSERL